MKSSFNILLEISHEDMVKYIEPFTKTFGVEGELFFHDRNHYRDMDLVTVRSWGKSPVNFNTMILCTVHDDGTNIFYFLVNTIYNNEKLTKEGGIPIINPFEFGKYEGLYKWCIKYHREDSPNKSKQHGSSTTNVVSQKTATTMLNDIVMKTSRAIIFNPILDSNKNEDNLSSFDLEDLKLDKLEELEEWVDKKRNELLEIGGGKWYANEDTIIEHRIRLSFGYSKHYPYLLVDDTNKIIDKRISIRRLENIYNALKQRYDDITNSKKSFSELIENAKTKNELLKLEFDGDSKINTMPVKPDINDYISFDDYFG